MKRIFGSAISLLLILLLWCVPQPVGAAQLVLYYPDGPQESGQVVAAFRSLRKAAGSMKLKLKAQYIGLFGDFEREINIKHPELAIVDVVYYLENRTKYGMEILARAHGIDEKGARPYCLFVRSTRPWSRVSQLKGKLLAQTHLAAAYQSFIRFFLFEGAISSRFFRPKLVADGRSAIQAVGFEAADSAFVPCGLLKKYGGKKFKAIFRSRPIPYPLLVSFSKASASDKEKATRLFTSLRSSDALLVALGIGRFSPVTPTDAANFDALLGSAIVTLADLRLDTGGGSAASVEPSPILDRAFPMLLQPKPMVSGAD